jgi:hypothetical protein
VRGCQCSRALFEDLKDIRIAALSTMFRIVNLLIALSLGVQREQLLHLIGFTCPRPDLLRPLEERFLTILSDAARFESVAASGLLIWGTY